MGKVKPKTRVGPARVAEHTCPKAAPRPPLPAAKLLAKWVRTVLASPEPAVPEHPPCRRSPRRVPSRPAAPAAGPAPRAAAPAPPPSPPRLSGGQREESRAVRPARSREPAPSAQGGQDGCCGTPGPRRQERSAPGYPAVHTEKKLKREVILCEPGEKRTAKSGIASPRPAAASSAPDGQKRPVY